MNTLTRKKKKLIIIAGAAVLVIVAALIVLAALSNRILKAKLEQTLGTHFTVERISLSWGRVGVYRPRFFKDGQTIASAKSITLKADFLGLLKPGLSVSSIVLEEPFVKLEIGPSGKWMVPIVIEKKQETPSQTELGPFYSKQITIKEGTLLFQDRRFQGPDSIEFQKINLQLENISIPLKNEPSKFTLQFQPVGKLVSGLVSGSGTVHFKTLALDVKCAGQNLALFDVSAAGPAAHAQGISFAAASGGVPAEPLLISDLHLTKLYVRLEIDRKGNIVSPLSGILPKQTTAKKQGAPVRIEVKNLQIADGELLYLDGKIARPPYPLRLTDIELHADILSVPLADRFTVYQLSAHIPGNQGTGVLTMSGRANLKTIDTNSKIALRNLDLTGLKPYLMKKGDVDVSRGFLDLDLNLGIKDKTLYAPAHSVIKDLEFVRGSGLTDKFLGIPRSLVVNALETNHNQIAFDFTLEGNIENPKFNFRESLVKRFTIGLAKTLGLSVVEAGETIVIQGGRAIKGVGQGLEEVGKELKKLFK